MSRGPKTHQKSEKGQTNQKSEDPFSCDPFYPPPICIRRKLCLRLRRHYKQVCAAGLESRAKLRTPWRDARVPMIVGSEVVRKSGVVTFWATRFPWNKLLMRMTFDELHDMRTGKLQ